MLTKEKKILNNVTTVDPGYRTGLAHWVNSYYPNTYLLYTLKKDSVLEKIYDISLQWEKYLQDVKPSLVIIEGVCFWNSSIISQVSTIKGDIFNLAYLIGSLITKAKDKGIKVKLVYAIDTKINNVVYKGWKGQLDNKALQKRITRINGVKKYPQHIREAVGIGFAEMGIL